MVTVSGFLLRLSHAQYQHRETEQIKMGPLDDYGVSDKVTVEHLLVISLAEPLRQAIGVWSKSSKGTAKSLEILAYAAATFLVLTGVSRIIDSIRSKPKK